jgi:hypothetical protein
MPIISTGQFTIVDQNDAKPIMALISANGSLQQAYSKDNASELFTPNWVSSPLTLTAAVYVGGVNVVAGTTVTNRKWSLTFDGTSIGSTSTFVRNTNFAATDVSQTYFFTCTYTDPVTNIPSRVDTQITLSIVKTGTNAVYVLTSGVDVIVQSDTSTKNVAAIKAELVRSSGIDTAGLQYKWYSISSAGVATHLHASVAGVGNYGLKSTAIGAAPTGTSANLGAATFTAAGATANDVYTTVGSPGFNTLVVGEGAVNSFQLFKVDVFDNADNSSAVYTSFFTINDISDPYAITILSSNGDRLLNGLGSTTLTAKVYNGSVEIPSYANWTFDWYITNNSGTRVGFVTSLSPPLPDITATISTSTNSNNSVLLNGSAALNAGNLVKLVSADGAIVKFAQVAAPVGNTVTLQEASGDNGVPGFVTVTTIGPTEFAGGTLYRAVAKRTTTTNTLTVTQFDVDGKATIRVDANRP